MTKVKAKITSTVTEIAIVVIDREGNVDELLEVLETVDQDDI